MKKIKLGTWWWKKVEIDWFKFASKEEAEVYEWLRDWILYEKTWIEELKKVKLLDARPKPFKLFDSFLAWKIKVLPRRYTADFLIKDKNKDDIILEYKSLYTSKKPDYCLRRSIFLFFYKWIKFAELIKIKKWVYLYHKYY